MVRLKPDPTYVTYLPTWSTRSACPHLPCPPYLPHPPDLPFRPGQRVSFRYLILCG